MKKLIGSGGGGCFLGHTTVRTPSGLQAIETLKPGDLVVSFDDCGDLHDAEIIKVHTHENQRVIRYHLWGGGTLDATPNHWVLNQYNAFVEIDTLTSDDCLVDENGHLRPIVEREEYGIGTVYNLTVEGRHTFIASGIRVHNAGLGIGIAGAGGGKGGGGGATYAPTEEEDTLNSRQYATIVDLISEGEIEGLKNGPESIFLDNVALQDESGDFNFKSVSVATTNGTQNQAYIPLANGIENEIPVNVEVQDVVPVIRSVVDESVDAVRVTINVPALQKFTDKGDIKGSEFRIKIYVQYNNGGYVEQINDLVSGRTGDQFQKDYLVELDGAFPVDIKVVRGNKDSKSSKKANAFAWLSYTEITYAKLRYPNSAIVAMRVDARQFSAIPSRSYLIRGIKVRVPSNATVDSVTGRLIYSGVWNGSFGSAKWTTDPAWILWDLLTSTRYGFGDHILTEAEKASFNGNASKLDKWAFYAASQYSSALIPNGFGTGYEPRFSCNVNIQTQEDAYKLINDMCSVFRAMPYWSTGALTVSQDKPANTSYLFTLANVSEDGFSYQGSSLKTRPTVAVVSYLNLDTRDIDYEVVEDTIAIAKYGAVTQEISAFACTSRGQAHRLGEWLLYSEQYESEVVSFTTSIDAGVMVRPGQIIEIADPVRAGSRRGGRIRSASTQYISVDDTTATSMPAGSTPLGAGHTISVVLPDGTVESKALLSREDPTAPAASVNTTTNEITIEAHGFRTGDQVIIATTPGGTPISIAGTPLNQNGNTRYAIRTGVNTFLLASTYARAIDLISDDITSAGSGVHTFVDPLRPQPYLKVSPFSATPNENSIWIYQSTSLQTSTWRVLGVTEEDGAKYGVTALSYNSSKYDYIELDKRLQFRDVTNLNEVPEAPKNLVVTEAIYEDGGRALFKLMFSWQPVSGVNQYCVQWRELNGNLNEYTVQRLDYEILNAIQTTYTINVYSVNAGGKKSRQPASITYGAIGKSAPPADVTGAYGNIINSQSLELAWNLHPDLDVRVGGKILIRHTPRVVSANWADATTVVPAAAGNQTKKVVPLIVGTYLLKAEDDSGNTSSGAASVIINEQLGLGPTFTVRVASSPVANPDVTFAEDLTTPPFQGNVTNMYYDASLDGLILSYGTFVDDMATNTDPSGPLLDENGFIILDSNGDYLMSPGTTGSWDDLQTIDGYGGSVASGQYEFGSTMDLGAIYDVNLRARMQTRAFNPANLWDAIINVDLLTTIDDTSGNPDAQLQFRYSQDTITYSSWIPFQSNLIRGRSFQFKIVASSNGGTENILVEELGATALLPQYSQTAGPITSGATTYTVTFANNFYAAPQVAITAVDMTTGDYAVIASVTRSGFQVTFRNSGGTAVSRQFHYTATGYGREF